MNTPSRYLTVLFLAAAICGGGCKPEPGNTSPGAQQNPPPATPAVSAISAADQQVLNLVTGTYIQGFRGQGIPDPEARTLILNANGTWIWKDRTGREKCNGTYNVHPIRRDELVCIDADHPTAEPQRYLIRGNTLSTELIRGQDNYPRYVKQ